LGHESGAYGNLTAAENLAFSLRMAGRKAEPRAIDAALDRVQLHADRDERVRGFSAGMKRRLALARLLLRPPALLLLDEPYASFDADGVERVNELALQTAAAGGAVLVATHDLGRARSILQRRLSMDEGRLREVGPGDAAVGVGIVPGA
jgi:heme exporter protein A